MELKYYLVDLYDMIWTIGRRSWYAIYCPNIVYFSKNKITIFFLPYFGFVHKVANQLLHRITCAKSIVMISINSLSSLNSKILTAVERLRTPCSL